MPRRLRLAIFAALAFLATAAIGAPVHALSEQDAGNHDFLPSYLTDLETEHEIAIAPERVLAQPGTADLSIDIRALKDGGFIFPNGEAPSPQDTDQSDPPPNTVWAGNEVVYEVDVFNSGPETAIDVVVTVTLPPGVRYLADTDSCTPSPAGGGATLLECELGDMEQFDSVEFLIKTRVDPTLVRNEPTGTTVIVVEAEVTSDTPDADLEDNVDSDDCFVQDLADLKITKLVEPHTGVQAGDTFTYTIYVDNLGPSSARNVTITDTLLSSGRVSIQSCAFSVSQGGGSITQFTCTTGNLVSTQFGTDVGTFRTNFLDPRSPTAQGRLRASFRLTAMQDIDVTNLVTVTADTPDPDTGNNMAMSALSVSALADLELTAPCFDTLGNLITPADPIAAGEQMVCFFEVRNNGPSDAEGTEISASIPAIFDILAVDGTTIGGGAAGCVAGSAGDPGDPATCNYGTLSSGGEASMRVELRVQPDAVTDNVTDRRVAQIDVRASSDTPDADLSNNFGIEQVDIEALADLNLDKFAVGAPVAGQVIHYEFQIDNLGPSVSRDVTLRDFLPDGVEFVDAYIDHQGGSGGGVPLPCTITQGSNLLWCDLGDIPPTDGVPVYVFANVRILPYVVDGTILTNNADVFQTDTPDPDFSNNSDDASIFVRTEVDLILRKLGMPQTPVAGTQFKYTLSLTNNGPSDAYDVEVTDTLPPGFTFMESTDFCTVSPPGSQTIVCRPAGSGGTTPPYVLPVGQTVSFDVFVEIDPDVFGPVPNLAEVTAGNPEPNITNLGDTVNVIQHADLKITKIVSPHNPVRAGEQFTYTILVDNLGPSRANNVVITDTLVSSGFVEANGCSIAVRTDGGAIDEFLCNFALSTGVFDLGTFGANWLNPRSPTDMGRVTITINLTADEPIDLTNVTTVTSDAFDPDMSNNMSMVAHSVSAVADIGVTKTAVGQIIVPGCPPDVAEVPNQVTAGLQLVYEMTVTNDGPSTAENVTLVDRLPPGITVISAEVPTGGSCATGTPGEPLDRLTCGLGTMVAGGSGTVIVTAVVDSSVPDGTILENDVLVYSDQFDDNNENDYASDLTTVSADADLFIEKGHEPEPAVAGEALSFNIDVINNGPSDAQNVVVTDTLPDEVVYVSAATNPAGQVQGSCIYDAVAHQVTCGLGTMPAGSNAIIDIETTVKPDAVPSGLATTAIDNTVTVSSTTDDPCQDNNQFTDTVNVNRESAVLNAKVDTPDPVLAGDEVTYTISFGNEGPSTATTVVVRDQLPTGLSYVRCEPADPANQVICSNLGGGLVEVVQIMRDGNVVWANPTQAAILGDPTLNDLDPGEGYSFDLVALVSPGYVLDGLGDLGADACGPIAESTGYPHYAHNVATIDGLTSDFEISECTRVNAAADLELDKTDIFGDPAIDPETYFLMCDPVAPGGMITYTLTVDNLGPSDAAEVVLTDWLPEAYVAVDPAQVMVDIIGGEGVVEEIRDDGRVTIVLGNDPARLGTNAGQNQIGRINAGQSSTVIIAVMVRQDARCGGEAFNRASVTTRQNNVTWPPIPGFEPSRTPTLDPDPTNNVDIESTRIECPSVRVIKTVSYDGTCPGTQNPTQLPTAQPITFCYEITNTGTTYLDEIEIEDVLDTRTTMPTVIFTDTITSGLDPKIPVPPGETVLRQVTVPSLYKDCGLASNTVTVTANPVNSGRTDLACLPDVTDTDTRNIEIPCAGVDWRVALPILEANEGMECDAWIQVQNVGNRDSKAALVIWGNPGFCPPQAAGPLKVECSGLLRPGSAWSFALGQLPQGSRSAIAYSLNATDVIPDFDGNDRIFADVVCSALFSYAVGDHDRWASFDRAYRLGDVWRGPRDQSGFQLTVDLGAHQGEPLTLSVNRSCPDAADPNAMSNAAYTGLSRDQLGVRDPVSGAYMYYAPLIFASNAGLNTLLYLQNLGDECTSLEIWLKGQDNCLRPIIGDILTLAPGETVAFDPNTVVGPDWLGSAWIRATQPIAMVVDSMGANHFTSYVGVTADIDNAGFTYGNQVNFAPLIYSEYQGWDTAIQVQNLSPVVNAKVKVYFLDRSGDVITTLVDWICPRGSQTFFLPTIAALGGNWVGSARIESQEWWTPGTNPVDYPRISSVVLLEKWSDPARTTRREAVAYNGQTECLLYDWQVGAGKGGTQSGSAVFAVPLLSKGNRGVNSELAITNLVAKPGFTDFAIFIYDQNGLLDFVCEKLHDRQVEYIDLATWGYVPPNFLGSAVVSATFWEHDVFDPNGGFVRNLVGLGGVVVERVGSRLGEPDVPGDESKAFEAAPIFDHFLPEIGGDGQPPSCPGQPGFGP